MTFIISALYFTTNLITGHHPEFWLRDANKKSFNTFMNLGESVPDPVSQLGDCVIGWEYLGRYWNEYTIYKNKIIIEKYHPSFNISIFVKIHTFRPYLSTMTKFPYNGTKTPLLYFPLPSPSKCSYIINKSNYDCWPNFSKVQDLFSPYRYVGK